MTTIYAEARFSIGFSLETIVMPMRFSAGIHAAYEGILKTWIPD